MCQGAPAPSPTTGTIVTGAAPRRSACSRAVKSVKSTESTRLIPLQPAVSDTPKPAAMPSSAPGKYALLAELGRGGMATAYLAAMQGPGGFNKLMVVKRLRPALATEPEFLRMFLQEARLAARIDHPNVVHTSEVGFDGNDHFIAMEYIEGQSLENIFRKVISRTAGLSIPPPSSLGGSQSTIGGTPTATSAVSVLGAMIPLPLHLFVLTQVLAGLDFAHELKDFDGNALNVVHRDVSPHNVMVTYEGHVKLLDFGIAKAADSNGDTRTGVMKGKCAYMPAEQFGGKVDRRADIFAVGVMLWQAITGRRLWKGLSDAEVFQRLSRDDVPVPSSVKDGVHPELESICMKALSYRPEDRFATAADFQAAIEDVIASDRALRATPRETGKYVSELFVAEREKVRHVIEQELGSRAGVDPKSSALPLLGRSMTGSIPAYTDPSRLAVASATAASPTLVTETDAVPPVRRGTRIAGIGLVAVAAAGVMVFALGRSGDAEQGASAGSASSAVAATVAPAPELTEFVTVPSDAHLYIDGAELAGSTRTFQRDGKRHLLNVEADGYEPRSDWFVFDRQQVEIRLTKVDTAKTKPVGRYLSPRSGGLKRQPEPPPQQPKVPDMTPSPIASKKGMGLDTGDPWTK